MGFKTRAPTRRFALELRPGLWGAAQQVASTDGRFRALALDWFGPTPPITAELAGCRPLLADHHSWDPAALLLVLDAAPDGLRPIDSAAAIVAPRPLRVERNAASFRRQLSAQWRWRCLPEAHRRGYKRARARFDDSIEIAVGADQPPQTVRAGVTRLRVATASPRWRALDALGALTEIDFEGDDPGLVEHLEHRPLIETLGWSSDQIRELDLRRTGLLSVRLATPALERLRLPAACESLRLQAAASLRVDQEGDGDGLVLIAFGSLGSLRTLFGLERLRRIEILFAREHDCAELARFPHLERVRFHEVERLRSFASLAALPRLRRLEIRSCYDLDVELAPPLSSWPALEQLSIDGLRASDAAIFKRRAAGDRRLELRGAKSEAWLRANIDNPFRDWVDHHDAPVARAATRAYTAATRAIAARPGDLDAALRDFVGAFNEIDARGGIDTADREEICAAFFELVAQARASADDYETRLDEWREF
jgi:hypothetical protein